MPLEATLRLTRPPVFAGIDDAGASKALTELVLQREAKERAEILARGGRFLGAARILRQKLTQTPKSVGRKFKLSPKVGAKNKWARIEALRRLKVWGQAYKEAYDAWRAGQRDVVFPYGTYGLKRFSGVCCAALT